MENTKTETTEVIFTDIENQISELKLKISEEISPENNNKYSVFIGILYFFIIGLLCAIATDIVYIIMALVNTSSTELQDICPETNLWAFLLVYLLIGTVTNQLIAKDASSEERSYIKIISKIIINLCVLCWGSYELWGVDCVNEIKSNLIYKMALINVVSSWIINVIATIIYSIVVLYKYNNPI